MCCDVVILPYLDENQSIIVQMYIEGLAAEQLLVIVLLSPLNSADIKSKARKAREGEGSSGCPWGIYSLVIRSTPTSLVANGTQFLQLCLRHSLQYQLDGTL